MKRLILPCFFLALVFCACQSEKSFFSRRYTSGHYISKSGKPSDPVARKENTKLKSVQPLPVEEQIAPYLPEEMPEASASADKYSAFNKTLAARKINLKERISSPEVQKETTDPAIPEETPKRNKIPLFSVIVSGLGVIAMLVSFFLIWEFYAIGIFVAACVLAITGLVLGLTGIRQYRRARKTGRVNTSQLVLSIIGTAIAGGLLLYLLTIAAFIALVVAFY